eukprot:Gb_39882 [translate_table: standard]
MHKLVNEHTFVENTTFQITSKAISGPIIPGLLLKELIAKWIQAEWYPGNQDLWERELAKKRSKYAFLKEELLANPSERTRRMEEASTQDKQDSRSNEGGLLRRHNLTHGDHPLSLGETSVWHQFFQYTEITEQIERDVKRTHPDMPFFSGDSASSLENQEAIKHILLIFAKLNPAIQYVQGMNEVLAPLYYVFKTDPDEENADCNSPFNLEAQRVKHLSILPLKWHLLELTITYFSSYGSLCISGMLMPCPNTSPVKDIGNLEDTINNMADEPRKSRCFLGHWKGSNSWVVEKMTASGIATPTNTRESIRVLLQEFETEVNAVKTPKLPENEGPSPPITTFTEEWLAHLELKFVLCAHHIELLCAVGHCLGVVVPEGPPLPISSTRAKDALMIVQELIEKIEDSAKMPFNYRSRKEGKIISASEVPVELAGRGSTMAQIDATKESQGEVLKRLEESNKEINERKEALQATMQKAGEAKAGKMSHETVELGVMDDDVEADLSKLVNRRQTSDHQETLTPFDTESKETDLICGLDGGANSETYAPSFGPLDEKAKDSTSKLGPYSSSLPLAELERRCKHNGIINLWCGRWIPLPLPQHTSSKIPEHEKDSGTIYAAGRRRWVDQVRPLADSQRDEFEDMLQALTLERSQIKEVMGFALDNADAARVVVELITESLTLKETPIPTKMAGLC